MAYECFEVARDLFDLAYGVDVTCQRQLKNDLFANFFHQIANSCIDAFDGGGVNCCVFHN
jgi:hypothetical protein